jgi:hypothetical protein
VRRPRKRKNRFRIDTKRPLFPPLAVGAVVATGDDTVVGAAAIDGVLTGAVAMGDTPPPSAIGLCGAGTATGVALGGVPAEAGDETGVGTDAFVGAVVGAFTGAKTGLGVGAFVGALTGAEGTGAFAGALFGAFAGAETGVGTDAFVGAMVGTLTGAETGAKVGALVGALTGLAMGDEVGALTLAQKLDFPFDTLADINLMVGAAPFMPTSVTVPVTSARMPSRSVPPALQVPQIPTSRPS